MTTTANLVFDGLISDINTEVRKENMNGKVKRLLVELVDGARTQMRDQGDIKMDEPHDDSDGAMTQFYSEMIKERVLDGLKTYTEKHGDGSITQLARLFLKVWPEHNG